MALWKRRACVHVYMHTCTLHIPTTFWDRINGIMYKHLIMVCVTDMEHTYTEVQWDTIICFASCSAINRLQGVCSHEATCTELSPRTEQSSLSLCCISGMPASWLSSRSFSSLRLSRVAVSSFSILHPPSPLNCSRWVWNLLHTKARERSLHTPLTHTHTSFKSGIEYTSFWVRPLGG